MDTTPTAPYKSTPRDVFLYLLAIITLYISVWAFIDLLFEYINNLFPDKLDYYFSFDQLRLAISMLIVVFPVYLGLTWFLRKDVIKNPGKRELKVRKWLLNLTLFVAAMTIIVDLVTLVNFFLDGDLTTQFILKVIVVLVVAGAVLTYYAWDLRRETIPGSRPSRIIAGTVAGVVLVSIISGFFIIGSPVKQRQLRFDQDRVNHLSQIQSQIVDRYWYDHRKLPPSLNELNDDLTGYRVPTDPDTGAQYIYRMKNERTFELCANFSLATEDNPEVLRNMQLAPYPAGSWDHKKGENCFERYLDPETYSATKDKADSRPLPQYYDPKNLTMSGTRLAFALNISVP